MSQVRLARALCALALLVCVAAPHALADVTPNPTMLRDPDVNATHIVFVYAGDLWAVPRAGGVATPLASPPGAEANPRFSPDGKSIAFVGNYDGDRDLYTLPLEGGVPHRVTYHSTNETLADWAGDGSLIYYAFGQQTGQSHTELFTVSPKGGLPVQLPVPYGAKASIDAKGEWLAYTPWTRDQRTWKRYRGGMATDIWLFNLKTFESRKITDWEGTDTEPMWLGDKLYYLSDREEPFRRNVWSFDPATGTHEQVTRFKDYDIRYAAMGPGAKGQGEIVLQNGASLYLLDLASGKLNEVKVSIPGARPTLRAQTVDASKFMESYAISPSGKRVAAGARGDIWTLPAKNGAPRNLTRTSGAAERYPSWSPDGRWIAYSSDESGEYEIYVTQADGMGETRQLTKRRKTFYESVDWSPDSKKVTYQDRAGNLWIYDLDEEEETFVIKDDFAGTPSLAWSHDSRYVAFAMAKGEGYNSGIFVYDADEGGEPRRITSDYFGASAPAFDRKGEYLVYASTQHASRLSTMPSSARPGSTPIATRIARRRSAASKDGKSPLPMAPSATTRKRSRTRRRTTTKRRATKARTRQEGRRRTARRRTTTQRTTAKRRRRTSRRPVDLDRHRGLRAPASSCCPPSIAGNFSSLSFNDKVSGKLIYVRKLPRTWLRRRGLEPDLGLLGPRGARGEDHRIDDVDWRATRSRRTARSLLVLKNGKPGTSSSVGPGRQQDGEQAGR